MRGTMAKTATLTLAILAKLGHPKNFVGNSV
jgi:hypothetical protein